MGEDKRRITRGDGQDVLTLLAKSTGPEDGSSVFEGSDVRTTFMFRHEGPSSHLFQFSHSIVSIVRYGEAKYYALARSGSESHVRGEQVLRVAVLL